MIKIDIKPLSINQSYQGKRYKSKKCKNYEFTVEWMLPKFKMPEPPFKLIYEFGFSTKTSDIDNPIKIMTDILQKKYSFNDRDIYELSVKKKIVKKGSEYIKFEILSLGIYTDNN